MFSYVTTALLLQLENEHLIPVHLQRFQAFQARPDGGVFTVM